MINLQKRKIYFRSIFTFLFLLIQFTESFSQDLPHLLSDKEKEIYKTYVPPGSFSDYVYPPPTAVRTMAEWEEIRGIIIAWTTGQSSILRQIVDYAQDEGLVYIICSDSNSVKTTLTGGGVPIVNLKFIDTPYNSVWCRDYGPWAAYSGISDSLKIIDWIYNRPRPLDDQVPVAFANYINVPIFQAISSPNNLTHTGGNFMVDGHGTGFSSKLILTDNSGKTEIQINNIVNSYLGINRFIKMETLPYDQIHHIDMHMKLIDEETILVGQYPPGTADGPQIEANIQYVTNNFQTCFGRPYKIVRIPMPPNSSGQYPPVSTYNTYTNSVFVNKTVIVPVYGLSQDTTALRIYRENLPGYRIVGINCSSMISLLGAIHCITKEIGVDEPVFISHAKIRDLQNVVNPYEVKAYIKTKSGVSSAKVYWRSDTTQSYNQLPMAPALDTFKAVIPSQPIGSNVYYYISAISNSGRTVNKPLTAPTGYIKYVCNTPVSMKLNLTVLNEGMYDTLINQISRRDTFTVFLRNTNSPYTIVDSAKGLIDSLNFSALFTFTNASSGNYYIVVKHFNSIETWSKAGGELLSADGSVNNYDFTTTVSQAFGNNLKLVGSKSCTYSGDIDQNGSINLADLIAVYNESIAFSSGSRIPADLNADNVVNITDILICFNNPFVMVSSPLSDSIKY